MFSFVRLQKFSSFYCIVLAVRVANVYYNIIFPLPPPPYSLVLLLLCLFKYSALLLCGSIISCFSDNKSPLPPHQIRTLRALCSLPSRFPPLTPPLPSPLPRSGRYEHCAASPPHSPDQDATSIVQPPLPSPLPRSGRYEHCAASPPFYFYYVGLTSVYTV